MSARNDMEECPKCRARFDAMKHRAAPGMVQELMTSKSPEARISDAAKVRCPKCLHVFSSGKVKFFGYFNKDQMRMGAIIYHALVIAFVLGLLVVDLWKG